MTANDRGRETRNNRLPSLLLLPDTAMSVLASSLDPTSLLLGGVLLLCLLWWLSTRRSLGIPPGPGPALPLLGHLHLLPKDPRAKLWSWRRQYGDVVSLYLGGQLTVVLTSYSAIREALVTFADVFSDRPPAFLIAKISTNKGIGGSSGTVWKEQRKVSLDILRQMGMGKNVLADRIQDEITHYIQAIRDHQGAPMDLCRLTQVSISNNICSIVFGKRYDYEDPDFLQYMHTFDRNFKILGGTAIVNFIPVLGYLPGDLFKAKEAMANSEFIYSFGDKHMAEHQRAMDKGLDNTDDFIYSYLREIQKCRKLGQVDTAIDEEGLQKVVGDLFSAGTETTSNTLQWALLYFLHHPHVQDKCFQEVNDIIGTNRPPSMSDRLKLTYVEATIWEVLRKGDIAPLSVLHTTSRDVTFRGYEIPKDTFIMTALTCAAQDPEIWGDPENFRPERFIGPDGKLTRADELIPFGIGRRVCLGESLARMELFLYLTTLIQHFHFLPPEDGQLPSLEGTFGLTHMPQPYMIRAVPRW